jgi:hypothetical protein
MPTKKSEKPKGLPIFCDLDGKWKEEFENRLQTDDRVTLVALGNVKFEVLKHIHGRKDIEIIKVETRYMKKREKGTGLKVTVRSYKKPIHSQNK